MFFIGDTVDGYLLIFIPILNIKTLSATLVLSLQPKTGKPQCSPMKGF
jgi:hypothetical protein